MAKMLWCKEGKHWARMALNPRSEFPPRFCEVCDTAEYQTVIAGGAKRHAKKAPRPPNEVDGVLLELIRRDRTQRKRPLEEYDKYD